MYGFSCLLWISTKPNYYLSSMYLIPIVFSTFLSQLFDLINYPNVFGHYSPLTVDHPIFKIITNIVPFH